ncbi:hypothetical protein [Roseibium salinum]|uniref:YpeB-like protein with protease inhibitory function n=2 Tax=Roseibium salinum TaxID=1604349 RepID=A0ABT3R7Q2_9HYPH|nr:hypothetical protein [Roseibium sp. DSM 29163]MCX2725325.1 hypothetical protein [Roseibium sp. DSM 29163]
MFARFSKLSRPIAGAVLMVTAGIMQPAAAAPLAGMFHAQVPQSEMTVQVDHRRDRDHRPGYGRHGGRWGRHHALGPREISRSLRHRGFHAIRIVDRRGPMYIVMARGWDRRPVRLVVDSRTAHIVRVHPIGRRGGSHFEWQFRF